MSEWQDIETAPRDGTVILSNSGTVKFDDGILTGWYLCDLSGEIPTCADWGREVSEQQPTKWLDVLR